MLANVKNLTAAVLQKPYHEQLDSPPSHNGPLGTKKPEKPSKKFLIECAVYDKWITPKLIFTPLNIIAELDPVEKRSA